MFTSFQFDAFVFFYLQVYALHTLSVNIIISS